MVNEGRLSPSAIAVLGGCGFIGSHICRALVRGGHRVRIFEKTYADRHLISDLESEVEIFEGDIARPDDALAALADMDTAIHLVHTTVPGSSMLDPAYDVESNVVASAKWLSRIAETTVGKIIFISSGGTVYGIPQSNLIDELHPTHPISSYGITKLSIEKYVAMYCDLNGVQHLVLRPSNVYGEGQRLNIGQGVIGVLADNMLRDEKVEVWGFGESLRDYLYVEDFVRAVIALIDYPGAYRIFNVASGVGHSVADILSTLERQLGRKARIEYKPARGFDVPVNVLDYSRLKRETNWQPEIELEEGVARVLKWLKQEHPTRPAIGATI